MTRKLPFIEVSGRGGWRLFGPKPSRYDEGLGTQPPSGLCKTSLGQSPTRPALEVFLCLGLAFATANSKTCCANFSFYCCASLSYLVYFFGALIRCLQKWRWCLCHCRYFCACSLLSYTLEKHISQKHRFFRTPETPLKPCIYIYIIRREWDAVEALFLRYYYYFLNIYILYISNVSCAIISPWTILYNT